MKSFFVAALSALCLVAAAPAAATLSPAETRMLATVKAALAKVPGVEAVKSDLAKRQTTVSFDNAKTDIAALSRATGAAGFPSTPVKVVK